MAKFGGGYGAKRFKKLTEPQYGNKDEEDEESGGIGRASLYQPLDYSGLFGNNRYPSYTSYSRRVNYLSPISWRI